MSLDLDELERLARQATPGPWKSYSIWQITTKDNQGIAYTFAQQTKIQTSINTQYIVGACNAAPELIARVRELERQRDWLAQEIVAERIRTTTSKCLYSYPEDWIKAAEEAAKEAGNE